MRTALVGMLSVVLMSGSFADAADIAAGKEKAELCAARHGEAGISQTEVDESELVAAVRKILARHAVTWG